jgi:general secretion pathway protein M
MTSRIQSNAFVRRATFAAAHLAVGLAAYWLWLMPVWEIFADRDAQIAKQHTLLGRLEDVASHDGTVQELVRNAASEFDRGEFLVGPNDGVVGADLQTHLKAIAEAGGAKLQSVQSLPTTHDGGVKYVGARIELVGSLAAIQRAIHALETGKPYLFVTAATLKSSSSIARLESPAEPVIDAQLDVFGALRPERTVR